MTIPAHKNTPRSPDGERGAKHDVRFFTAARSLQSRSYAAGGARYLQADLMLLTHAGCAFKDPRGRFGISYPIAVPAKSRHRRGSEIRGTRLDEGAVLQPHRLHSVGHTHSFALLRCAVTASAEQPLLSFAGAGCRRGCGPVDAGDLLTCTGRPDGSGARSGRLQPAGCVRTAPLHGRGMHGSGGCNGSRLPAVPDTCRCPRPWMSE